MNQMDHHPFNQVPPRSPHNEVPLIPPMNDFGGVNVVSPDEYQFSSPLDFGTYCQKKCLAPVKTLQPHSYPSCHFFHHPLTPPSRHSPLFLLL
jgi:hypothetical protein